MSVLENIQKIQKLIPANVTLVAVSKTKSNDAILEAFQAGQKVFGENRVQELIEKQKSLPSEIEWHLIGHLQSNKVKYIVPFVSLIHSVDSLNLLSEINKEGVKIGRKIPCLLEIKIAQEDSKHGMSESDAEILLDSKEFKDMKHVQIDGLMGIATNSDKEDQVRSEFKGLSTFLKKLQAKHPFLHVLSMGMSGDFQAAIQEGSTMIRVGSLLFGDRK